MKHHEARTGNEGKDWLNASGYRDPTAYEALRNIMHEEKKKHG